MDHQPLQREDRKGVQKGERTRCWSHEAGDPRRIVGLHARINSRSAVVKQVLIPLSHIEHSSSMELMIETTFLSEVLQEAWFARHQLVDILHSTVDAFGYDVVMQCGDVTRHVQLKAKKKGGSTRHYAINTLLTERPAGCVVWEHVPTTNRMNFTYYWFGAGPDEPLTGLGVKVSKHARANAQGEKSERLRMRDVKFSAFTQMTGIDELVDRLFGPSI
jgi:hypothetical protein